MSLSHPGEKLYGMLVTQAYRFELDPNDHKRSGLASHAGAARFAYNWGLATITAELGARRALFTLAMRQGATAEAARAWAGELCGPVPWSLPALRRRWNQEKHEVAPWWAENSKEAYNSGLDALARALKGFFRSRAGERAGRAIGFPSFKKKGSHRSYRVTTGSFGVLDDRHVRLPRIGALRTKERTSTLTKRLAAATARVLSVTVSEHSGRWYVSFTAVVERAEPKAPVGPAIGVDVGARSTAVLSDGRAIPAPKHLSRYSKRMARLQRECFRRQDPGKLGAASKRWQRSRARLARAHTQVANARQDVLHKLTTELVKGYRTVVVEDLNVAGLTASARGSGHWRGKSGLNRALLNCSPGELRRQLAYKAKWYGSSLVVADRYYPSSKRCSSCGSIKTKLTLRERIYNCEACGLVIDRDHNAALNLAALVAATGTASGAGTHRDIPVNAQGDDTFMPSGRWSSLNCEDGTGQPGKAATAAEQSTAA
jgi:putative transposase